MDFSTIFGKLGKGVFSGGTSAALVGLVASHFGVPTEAVVAVGVAASVVSGAIHGTWEGFKQLSNALGQLKSLQTAASAPAPTVK